MLRERGEFVDAQARIAEGAWVHYGGPGAPPVVLDGPFPETKELIAGWFLIDVESEERAHEIAAYVSSAPGPGGKPISEWLEVRPLLTHAGDDRVNEVSEDLLRDSCAAGPRRAGTARRTSSAPPRTRCRRRCSRRPRWPQAGSLPSRRVAHDCRPPQARRWPASRRRAAAARAGRRGSPSIRPDRAGRRHSAAAVPVLPSCAVAVGGCRADAARGRGAHDSRDRRGVPGAGGDDRAADQPRQAGDRRAGLTEPGDVTVVLRVLYLIFNEGYTAGADRVDLAAEAIRLTRLLKRPVEPEVGGLLALMLLHHARRFARYDVAGMLVPLDEQDRSIWDSAMIAEGVRVLTRPWPGNGTASTRRRRPSPRCMTTRRSRGDRLAADPRLV